MAKLLLSILLYELLTTLPTCNQPNPNPIPTPKPDTIIVKPPDTITTNPKPDTTVVLPDTVVVPKPDTVINTPPPDTTPTINKLPTAYINNPDTVFLGESTVTLDGRKSKGNFIYSLWRLVQGDTSVNIYDPYSLVTEAYFIKPGRYGFELTLYDSLNKGYRSRMYITVKY